MTRRNRQLLTTRHLVPVERWLFYVEDLPINYLVSGRVFKSCKVQARAKRIFGRKGKRKQRESKQLWDFTRKS